MLEKRRPVVVISPDVRNRGASDVLILPCSTVLTDAPTHVRLRKGEGGLSEISVVKCEQISNVVKAVVDELPLGGMLDARRLRTLETGILRAIGIAVPLD